jgi:hypothetical protein
LVYHHFEINVKIHFRSRAPRQQLRIGLFFVEGMPSNRAAIGARIAIQVGKRRQFGEVRGGC